MVWRYINTLHNELEPSDPSFNTSKYVTQGEKRGERGEGRGERGEESEERERESKETEEMKIDQGELLIFIYSFVQFPNRLVNGDTTTVGRS